ncbi:telomeric repeat-binding factor 2 isoform X2 [Cygnus olor]|uniref:telomeric repeat-binding factor 2 isoform X2 n=1 Tax=Cygnus olor TaxID=8869 RepID=UPI001ADE3A9E|nr:telomeric repeat-binding factor 2 isoform X2 [Cygnus olor]
MAGERARGAGGRREKAAAAAAARGEEAMNRWVLQFYFHQAVAAYRAGRNRDFRQLRDVMQALLVRPLEKHPPVVQLLRVMQFLSRIEEGENLDCSFDREMELTPLESAMGILQLFQKEFSVPEKKVEPVQKMLKEAAVIVCIRNREFDKASAILKRHMGKDPRVQKKKAELQAIIREKNHAHPMIRDFSYGDFQQDMFQFLKTYVDSSEPVLVTMMKTLNSERAEEPKRSSAAPGSASGARDQAAAPKPVGMEQDPAGAPKPAETAEDTAVPPSPAERAEDPAGAPEPMEESSYPAAAPEHIIAAVKNLEDVSERMEIPEQAAAAAPELAEVPSRDSERWAEKSGPMWWVKVGGRSHLLSWSGGWCPRASDGSRAPRGVSVCVGGLGVPSSGGVSTLGSWRIVEGHTAGEKPDVSDVGAVGVKHLQAAQFCLFCRQPSGTVTTYGISVLREAFKILSDSRDSDALFTKLDETDFSFPKQLSPSVSHRNKRRKEEENQDSEISDPPEIPNKVKRLTISKLVMEQDNQSNESSESPDSSQEPVVSSASKSVQKLPNQHESTESAKSRKGKWSSLYTEEQKDSWSDEEELFSGVALLEQNGHNSGVFGSKKQKWTVQESEWIKEGVKKYGEGRWKSICQKYPFQNRTSVMIKDRWRTMKRLGML